MGQKTTSGQRRFLHNLREKMRTRYHIVLYREGETQEAGQFPVTLRTVLAVAGALCILLVGVAIALFMFTPLKEWAPGYTDPTLREELIFNTMRLDSLERELAVRDRYFAVLQAITRGEDNGRDDSLNSITQSGRMDFSDSRAFAPSTEDSILRAQVEADEMLVFESDLQQERQDAIDLMTFMTPAPGSVTGKFLPENRRFGLRIETTSNAVVATLGGTVTLAVPMATDTCIVRIQHANDLISSYKIAGEPSVETGSRVATGDTVLLATGRAPHTLQFELWYRGAPVDPEKYLILP
ncbi:MAG: M23 family metallopeptidase [Bacteroidales bacterium]|nr:M23 family metallopeptidase [Bacteroidales bacterium]